MSSTFGRLFTLTTYGESHGPALGGVVDGCPPGLALDEAVLQRALDLRKPRGPEGTARREPDAVRLLSGVFEGRTTGTPIAFLIENTDQRPADYGRLAEVWRPGHADMTYDAKYGLRDHRGGGRASARETAARVAGGAIAEAFLRTLGISVRAWTEELGGVPAPHWTEDDLAEAPARAFAAPCAAAVPLWDEAARAAREQGDSLGGIVRVEAVGLPAGLGEPVFDKLDAVLAHALMSVGAVKGVEVGSGFAAARMKGGEHNDAMLPGPDGGIAWASNHAGGILGGISTGAPVLLRAAIKPIPSIAAEQQTLDVHGKPTTLRVGGRHDMCAIPRVVPVLQAMTALALTDMVLLQRRMAAWPPAENRA